MRLSSLLSCVLVGGALSGSTAVATDLQDSDLSDIRAASIYIQSVSMPAAAASKPRPPALLAEIRYDVLDPSTAQVVAYEPPEVDSDNHSEDLKSDAASLYRIGLYDAQTKQWLAGTSVASASNFAKGYSPHFVLTVAPPAVGSVSGSYLGVSVRGLSIDAGATRDFGPQATVLVAAKGSTPILNRPVVLNPEGKKAAPEEEKTFFQKYSDPLPCLQSTPCPAANDHRYWWLIGVVVLLVLTSGGGEEGK
ncbi:hypothetical protein SEPCBS119000_000007 [Sporothrix epigloea]|uniref:Cyclin-dependent protein kinase regulator pho80 n=1 Tax=Sporothrix epigloea TaxID=1892477 RepID=A0ABP0D6H9_9PEZI